MSNVDSTACYQYSSLLPPFLSKRGGGEIMQCWTWKIGQLLANHIMKILKVATNFCQLQAKKYFKKRYPILNKFGVSSVDNWVCKKNLVCNTDFLGKWAKNGSVFGLYFEIWSVF